MGGQVISEGALGEMLRVVDTGQGGQYGLGIVYGETPDGTFIEHSGATGGFQSYMTYIPEYQITVLVLSNNYTADYVDSIAVETLLYVFAE